VTGSIRVLAGIAVSRVTGITVLPWLGVGDEPKIVLVAVGAFFPVYRTTASALSQVDPHLSELGRAYGLGRPALLRTIQLPAVGHRPW